MTTRESAEKKFVSSTESPLAVDKMSQKLLVGSLRHLTILPLYLES